MSWVVLKRMTNRIQFTIETRRFKYRLGWFHTNKHQQYHDAYVKRVFEIVDADLANSKRIS